MSTLDHLSPKAIWQIFAQICSIPHPSKFEGPLRDHIRKLCGQKGLPCVTDSVGNLIIRKPATPGLEHLQPVVLQGHLDMVPQKNADSNHQFEKDPIDTVVHGDWLKANGTTLGADNGIGVAAALAVLLSDEVQHGPLEVLCTVEEETSMGGAFGLKPDLLNGNILLNLDTEDEGELYVGCAGGVDINAAIPCSWQTTPEDYQSYEVKISGLNGGHSGLDIHLGRGNANHLVNRFLLTYQQELSIRVAQFNGGNLRNAIPRESMTLIALPSKKVTEFLKRIDEFASLIREEYGNTEAHLSIVAIPVDTPSRLLSESQQRLVVNAIAACVSAPFRMSDHFAGVVETSNNLAIVKTVGENIEIKCLTRSLVNSARDYAASSIAATFQLAGAQTHLDGAYPGWKPNPDSKILQSMLQGYKQLYGNEPAVKVIHAGLECGLFGEPYPSMDMISFGPTIRGAHSPDERVLIPSVEKFWNFLLYTLKNIPPGVEK